MWAALLETLGLEALIELSLERLAVRVAQSLIVGKLVDAAADAIDAKYLKKHPNITLDKTKLMGIVIRQLLVRGIIQVSDLPQKDKSVIDTDIKAGMSATTQSESGVMDEQRMTLVRDSLIYKVAVYTDDVVIQYRSDILNAIEKLRARINISSEAMDNAKYYKEVLRLAKDDNGDDSGHLARLLELMVASRLNRLTTPDEILLRIMQRIVDNTAPDVLSPLIQPLTIRSQMVNSSRFSGPNSYVNQADSVQHMISRLSAKKRMELDAINKDRTARSLKDGERALATTEQLQELAQWYNEGKTKVKKYKR